jgi:hypothetical protein
LAILVDEHELIELLTLQRIFILMIVLWLIFDCKCYTWLLQHLVALDKSHNILNLY